jgi:hypothetical protein
MDGVTILHYPVSAQFLAWIDEHIHVFPPARDELKVKHRTTAACNKSPVCKNVQGGLLMLLAQAYGVSRSEYNLIAL